MLLAFAAGSALLLGSYKATNAQTTALSPEEASARWICRPSGDTVTYDAVSYTHLDVYKRQNIRNADIHKAADLIRVGGDAERYCCLLYTSRCV